MEQMLRQKCRIPQLWIREFLAEFMGTMILLILGDGSVAQVVLSESLQLPKGSFFTINIGYSLAVVFSLYTSVKISGGHLNPAVSLSLAVLGRMPLHKLGHYIIAQYLGAMMGSVFVVLLNIDAINAVGYITPDTASILTTFPLNPLLSTRGQIIDTLFGTALLLFLICALNDNDGNPVLFGLIVLALGVSYGFNCGYALNPARDLGPRIVATLMGWNLEPFTYGNHYWLIPSFVTYVGALLGTFLYTITIGIQLPQK